MVFLHKLWQDYYVFLCCCSPSEKWEYHFSFLSLRGQGEDKPTENTMAMKSKVPETSRTERQDKAQEILKNRRVSEIKEWLMVSTLQRKPTPLWHVQISDTWCRAGCGVLLTELVVDGAHASAVDEVLLLPAEDTTSFPSGGRYSRYFSRLRVQEWLLQHIEPCQESVA